jgi:hypothetical protein
MDNLQEAYLSVYQELDEDGYKSPYQAPPAHGRSFQGNPQKGETLGNPARLSPAMRATQKSDQLRASEPGSTRERKQTTRARQLQRNFQSSRTVREETDLFDYLLEYLVAEGYADTNDAAIAIMANMSEEWKQSIVEETKRTEYLQKKFDAENKAKSGSAHTYIPGKQNTGSALYKARQSERQMKGDK